MNVACNGEEGKEGMERRGKKEENEDKEDFLRGNGLSKNLGSE